MPRRSTSEGTGKVVKKFPASENGPGVHCTTTSGQVFIITQCLEKMRFTLWRQVEGGYEKLDTAKSPLILEKKIPWDK